MVNSLGFARRAVAGVATAAILATQLVTAPFAAAQSAEFSDVSMDNFAYDYIYALVDMGIVSGNPDGTFRPNAYLNRAEMAKIAVKLAAISGVIADANDISNAPSFTDVPSDAWFYGYVSAAAKNGIFEGYRDEAGNLTGMFGAADTVLRAQAAKVLMIAAGVPTKLTPAAPFVDVNPSDWFYGYVTSAYNWSVLDGYKDANDNLTGYFGPADPVTRAQISKIAVNSQNPVDRYDPTNTPSNGNTNSSNGNTNSSNGNSNVVTSNASFEAALSSSTPTGVTLATGTAFNTVAKVDLTAGNEEDVKVTAITISHLGLSPDSIVNGVLVVDKDGARHGNIVSFSDSKAIVDFSSNPIVVTKGTTHTIALQANFKTDATFSSGTFKVEIPANGIKAMGASTGGVVNTMGLPVAGYEYSLVTGNNIADVKVTKGTEQGSQTLDIGVTNRTVATFKFEQTNSKEAIQVSELTVYNNGTSADGDVKNLKLVDQAGVVLATVEKTTNRYATFKFDKPYEIGKGNSRTFDLRIDVANGSSRTVEFQVLNDYDVKVKGVSSQAFLLPTNSSAFPLSGSLFSTINDGKLIVARATTSPSGEISNGTDDTVLAEFTAEAFGEDIEIQGGEMTLDWGISGNPTTGSVRLMTASGQTIHSVTATDFANTTSAVLPCTDTTCKTIAASSFNSTYTVKAGTTTTLRIVANMKETAANGEAIIASLGNLRVKKLSSNKYETGTSTYAGNALTVSTATITVSKNVSTSNQDVVAGGVNQAIGTFNIKATNSGDVSITSVKLDVAGNTNLTNLTLKKENGEALGTPFATVTSSNLFSFAGQLIVPAGKSVTLTAYANVKTDAAGSVTVTIPEEGVTGTAKNADVKAPAVHVLPVTSTAVTLQTYTIQSQGSVTLSATNVVSNSRVVTAGATNESLLSFKVKAADREAMTLNKLTVQITGSGASSIASVVLKKDGVNVASPLTLILNDNGTPAIPGDDVYSVEFTGLNQEIARNGEANYIVAVNVASVSTSIVAGGEVSATITAFEANGKASGQLQKYTGAPIVGSVVLTLHKVTPVIAKQTMATSAVPGITTTVAKFSVTANGSEAMTLKALNFTVGGNRAGGSTISAAKLYRVSGESEVLVATNEPTEVAGVLSMTITGGYNLAANENAVFVLKANTSTVMTGKDTASVGITLPANGLEYSYTGVVSAFAPTTELVFDAVKF